MQSAGRCAYSFLANLFLNPRTLGAIAEYWLRNYLEPTLLRGAPEPQGMNATDIACHMIRCLYQGVDDIVLVGQGNLAVSNDSPDPRYVHYVNFIAPAGRDFSFALPTRHFLDKRVEEVLTTLLSLYMQNEEVWRSGIHAATLGEQLFLYFRAGPDLVEWRLLYSPLAFALETVCRLVMGLRREASPAWFCADTGGLALLRALLAALARPRAHSLFHETEDAVVAALQKDMETTLAQAGSSERMAFACRRLMQARREMHLALADKYATMSASLNRRYCLDDIELLPWENV